MRKNLHEINNIREAMYQLQDAFEKFDVCVPMDMRHSTDIEIADEMYHIVKELNNCVVSLATKGDDNAKV
jgi:Xaa-Pro aminopeptidase